MKKFIVGICFVILVVLGGCFSGGSLSKGDAVNGLKNNLINSNNNISIINYELRRKMTDNIEFINKFHRKDIQDSFTKYTVFSDTNNEYVILVEYGAPPQIDSYYYTFVKQRSGFVLQNIQFAD